MIFKKRTTETVITKKVKERDQFLKNFHRFLKNYNEIVIFIHERPDGDCLGGAFGLKEVIKSQYLSKNIYVVGESQGVFPWLHMEFDELPVDFNFENAVAIILDSGVGTRTQRFQEYFKNLGTKKWGAVIRIDHHDSHLDFYTDLAWVDGSYAACCAQLVQICDYYQWELNCKAATYFFLGIMTDSSFFTNTDVSPRTLVLAAKALRAGADREFLVNNLKRTTKTEIELRSQILSNYVQEEGFNWYFMKKDIVDRYAPYSLTGNQVSTLGYIEDNVMWILFVEQEDGTIRTSFRSIGRLDVKVLAEEFGGGGHTNAAGAILPGEDKIPEVINRVKSFLKQSSAEEIESVDEYREELRDLAMDDINPRYRLELTDEEKKALEVAKRLIKESREDVEKKTRIEEWNRENNEEGEDMNSLFKSSEDNKEKESETTGIKTDIEKELLRDELFRAE
ncbi:DHH family phosphoesterase [Candidatus Mycoplasma haematominutum]|uniref:DHH family phosphoesterase (MgpA-like protein) n=1 Tax=Candidatus Mycoplasma haematominutum 'Birmingham 1' TaxID=1116213 RepID=G8C2N1_9MOLU|nr:bifunctional oligoribonuclease/PAP phosphatase NrnA [Candidatus Mycoplasma haematominutum]CCE66579.1 DHH family phosphoesterase (MgpA-like protein) [Candidatus Mycoplasma haematominutum 'Birmingham 1']